MPVDHAELRDLVEWRDLDSLRQHHRLHVGLDHHRLLGHRLREHRLCTVEIRPLDRLAQLRHLDRVARAWRRFSHRRGLLGIGALLDIGAVLDLAVVLDGSGGLGGLDLGGSV